MKKSLWILMLVLFALVLTGCNTSRTLAMKSESQPVEEIQLQENPTPGSSSDSPNGDPDSPQLPVPTVGVVVITNTTATPIPTKASASALTPSPTLQKLAEQAKENLANQLGIDINQIELAKIVPAKWPYDNLGCPLPEAGSIDASTPGYQILLKTDDQVYTYHTDGQGWIGLCNIKPPDEIRTLP